MTAMIFARIPRSHSNQLGQLRTLHGLDIGEDGEHLWIRASTSSETIQRALRSLSGADTFTMLPDNQLIRTGRLVPSARCPNLLWQRLSQWLTVQFPIPAFPAETPRQVALKLIRSSDIRPPSLLLTTGAAWHEYGITAPKVRLDRWHFAMSSLSEVVIRGWPLPPIPGTQFVEDHGVAVACGYHWSPDVDASIVARKFRLNSGDLVIWMVDDRRELIPAEEFVKATRSAIRRSTRLA